MKVITIGFDGLRGEVVQIFSSFLTNKPAQMLMHTSMLTAAISVCREQVIKRDDFRCGWIKDTWTFAAYCCEANLSAVKSGFLLYAR